MLIGIIAGLVIGIGLLITGGVRLNLLKKMVDYKSYNGKEVFETTIEYGKFKRAIGSNKVTDYSASVLSSEPPIVVQFNANVVAEGILGYGKELIHTKDEFDTWLPLCWILGSSVTLVGIVFLIGLAIL
jgi:hypothetical protein